MRRREEIRRKERGEIEKNEARWKEKECGR